VGFDLVIRGATVVMPGHRETAGIGVAGGRIAQIGGMMTAAEELAAGGLPAIPNGIDAHTHLGHRGLGDRLVDLTSANAARIFGLSLREGAVLPTERSRPAR
jgi:dihydroorotase